jgi:RNA polymerase sigma factor (sigma-70 family)
MQYKDDSYYIDQILAGEMNAFVFLVDKHKIKAFNIAFRILKSRENAEEVTQDSFLKAYQSLKDFRRESKFSSWLYRIIFNNAMSLLRKKKLKIDSYDDENFTWMEPADTLKELEKFHGQEQKKYINEALDKLSGEDASIVTLFYLDDCSIEEISDITGLGISNVKVKLFRSRKILYDELHKILQSEVKEIF